MKKRTYQTSHIDNIISSVSDNQKILAQLPTGGGKTVEFSLIAKRYIEKTGKAVLILVHREELMMQANKTIKEITGFKPVLIQKTSKRHLYSRVYIGMVESLVRRLDFFSDVGLVIIDECHINNFIKVHEIFLDELIIGFTATPISASKKEPLNKYYKDIVVGPQISDLIKLGFLAQNITRCPKEVVDATKLEVDRMKGDFHEGKMAIEYKKPRNITNAVRNYIRYCVGTKTVVFNVTIEHSKSVNDCFCFLGYNSRHLDSDSSNRPSTDPRFKNEREEILHWFKVTPDAILNNVMIATVGFDEPTIQNVIINFSTLSVVKFIQCCGRGGRIIDNDFIEKFKDDYPYQLEEKEHFNIIDMGGNAIRFGDWNDDRDWKFIFNNPDAPPGEGVAPVKICPQCEGMVHAAIKICPLTKDDGELCEYEFERKQTQEEKDTGELLLITKGIDVDNLIQRTQKKFDYFLFFKMVEPIVKNVFETYENPSETVLQRAFDSYYQLCIDWYNKTLAGKDGNIPDITNSEWHIKRARNNFIAYVELYRKQNILRLNKNVKVA